MGHPLAAFSPSITVRLLTAIRRTERVETEEEREWITDEAESCYGGWGGGGGSVSLQPCEKQPRNSYYSKPQWWPCVSTIRRYRFTWTEQQTLPVLFHDVLKRPQEVFLESEVGQLPLLQKLHGQLPERVHRENGHVFIGTTANLHGDKTYFSNITLFAFLYF